MRSIFYGEALTSTGTDVGTEQKTLASPMGFRERPEELEEGEGKGSTFQGLESRGSESG